MKDSLKKDLEIGDYVAYIEVGSGTCYISIGLVFGFTNQKVRVLSKYMLFILLTKEDTFDDYSSIVQKQLLIPERLIQIPNEKVIDVVGIEGFTKIERLRKSLQK